MAGQTYQGNAFDCLFKGIQNEVTTNNLIFYNGQKASTPLSIKDIFIEKGVKRCPL